MLLPSRSESPTQAYLVLVIWLYKKFKALQDAGKSAEDIKKAMGATCLAYDMCHVDSLRLAKKDLPFPAPFNQAWKLVSKVIDRLHLRNHKDPACKRLYNAEDKLPSQYNTMACEQTFVWASRLKKVICAMPRLHQFFFLHRSVKQRNTYTQRCHQNNKTPVLPKLAKVDRWKTLWKWLDMTFCLQLTVKLVLVNVRAKQIYNSYSVNKGTNADTTVVIMKCNSC